MAGPWRGLGADNGLRARPEPPLHGDPEHTQLKRPYGGISGGGSLLLTYDLLTYDAGLDGILEERKNSEKSGFHLVLERRRSGGGP